MKSPQDVRRHQAVSKTEMTDEIEVVVETRTERRVSAVVRPVLISQRTSLATTGVEPAGFLGLLPAYRADGEEVISAGKRRLVYLDRFVAWLSARSKAAPEATAGDDQVDDAEAYEQELGLRAVAGGRRGR